LKNYYKRLLLTAFASLILAPSVLYPREAGIKYHRIESGKIIIYTDSSIKTVPVDGIVDTTYLGDDGLFYIKTSEESGGPVAYIGCVDEKSPEIRCEMKLALPLKDLIIRKLVVNAEYACILTRRKTLPGESGVLYRIATASLQASQIPDVIDIYGAGRDIALLVRTGSMVCAVLNGVSVPLSIKGDLQIQGFVDGRLVFVANDIETEIIDIRTAKALYQYSSKYEYILPDQYNFMIQAVDEEGARPENDGMVFFRVFINGQESGRTGTGPGRISKEFRISVEANKEYAVQLERWELNSIKGRYERANKVHQPKLYQVFVPHSRIIKLSVKYSGKSYLNEISPLYR
jgi:hypothetical protein